MAEFVVDDSRSLGDLMDDMFTSNVEFALREQIFDPSLLATSRLRARAGGGGGGGNLSVWYNMNIGAETETHLTGQIPWPVCHLLNWYILARPELFEGKSVVEIGAGVGLTGLLLAEMDIARAVHITDGQDEIMANLRANGKLAADRGRRVTVSQLRWESAEDRAAAVAHMDGCVDIILGADILAYTLGVPKTPLLAGKELMRLSSCDDPVFIVAYHTRFGMHHLDGVRAAAAELGMDMSEINVRNFLPRPAPPPLDIFSIWDGAADWTQEEEEEVAAAAAKEEEEEGTAAMPEVMLLEFRLAKY
jgi:hypothetical protein